MFLFCNHCSMVKTIKSFILKLEKPNSMRVERRISAGDHKHPGITQYHIYLNDAGIELPRARIAPLVSPVFFYEERHQHGKRHFEGREKTGEILSLKINQALSSGIEELVEDKNIIVEVSEKEYFKIMKASAKPARYYPKNYNHMISFVSR